MTHGIGETLWRAVGAVRERYSEAAVFLMLMLLKAGWGGFSYYPLLDDYIQYRRYSLLNDVGRVLMANYGMSARPLAPVIDMFVVSPFWGRLGIVYALVTVLYAVSALILYRFFKRHYGVSFIFLVIFALPPLTLEGSYWLSASTRIIVPLFFGCLGMLLIEGMAGASKRGTMARGIALAVLAAASYGCYEQTAVLCFMLYLTAFYTLRDKVKLRNVLWTIVPLIAVLAFYVWAGSIGSGDAAGRLGVSLSIRSVLGALYQIASIVVYENTRLTVKGFNEGLRVLLSSFGGVVFIVLLLAVLCLCFACLYKGRREEKRQGVTVLVLGVLLAAGPLAVFFLTASPWVGFRNMLPCMVGFGLIASFLLSLIPKKAAAAVPFITVVAAGVFIVGCVGDLEAYRDCGKRDAELVAEVYKLTDGAESGSEIAILNVPEWYGSCFVLYHEHIRSIGASDWALTGAAAALTEGGEVRVWFKPYASETLPDDAGEFAAVYYLHGGVLELVE